MYGMMIMLAMKSMRGEGEIQPLLLLLKSSTFIHLRMTKSYHKRSASRCLSATRR